MLHLKALVLFEILLVASSLTVLDFKPALFHTSQPSGFYAVDTGSNNIGQVLSFGDLNGDKYTDYLASNDKTSNIILVYYWDDSLGKFTTDSWNLKRTDFMTVSEIMICDVNLDGVPELFVTYLMQNGVYTSEIYNIICHNLMCSISIQNIDFNVLDNMTALPFIVDISGTGFITIFAFNSSGRYLVTLNSHQTLVAKSWSSALRNPSKDYNDITNHFASIIDINGDCNSDLVLVSSQNNMNSFIEFYIKGNNNLYNQLGSLNIYKNITWMTFSDIDSNGGVDMLFVAYQNGVYNPFILYNQNTPSDICVQNDNFPFNINEIKQVILPAHFNLAADSNIKLADFNFDGFPDIIAIFSINQFRKASVLVNQGQVFSRYDAFVDEIQQIGNPIQALVFDFTENGKIDIIIINEVTKSDKSSAFVRTSIVNNIIQDTLFIKILPIIATSSDDFNSNVISNAFGITIQWRITNLNGDKTISVLNQKFQWNYGSLQLPFVTNGLGRTNNYIQDLTVGYPGYGQMQTWTPIIPNSQLIVKRSPGQDWPLQTLLKDNSRVYDMIYISVICLVLMGMVILFLNWRQAQQDKRDHYNFIQMIR